MENWENKNTKIKMEIKKDSPKIHKETLRISNRLIGRYMKRLKPLEKKGFNKNEIKKIYNNSILELKRMVDKIKI